MSMPLEETYVSVDPDQDTASDNSKHAHCTYCQPNKAGPVYALCGEIKILKRPVTLPDQGVPANACQTCVELYYQNCVRCGAGPW